MVKRKKMIYDQTSIPNNQVCGSHFGGKYRAGRWKLKQNPSPITVGVLQQRDIYGVLPSKSPDAVLADL